MDMYQKRKQRKEKREQNVEENKSPSSTNINWFPGHMAKTKRQIKENIKLIDIVFEVIDSRLPVSSKIKDIDDIIRKKKHILIMTKKDLCDLNTTNKWVEFYKKKGINVLLMDLLNNKDYKKLIELAKELTTDIQDKRSDKGLLDKEIKALVVGVPNAGKSTLINTLVGKAVAVTGNKPGVTKQVNWLKTGDNLLLLDTPGILWPKLDNDKIALNLASLSAIKSDVFDINEIGFHILTMLQENYPEIIQEKYNIDSNIDVMEMYDLIGRHMGAIKNGEIDYDRVSTRIYNDVISGKIKGITFDIWK